MKVIFGKKLLTPEIDYNNLMIDSRVKENQSLIQNSPNDKTKNESNRKEDS